MKKASPRLRRDPLGELTPADQAAVVAGSAACPSQSCWYSCHCWTDTTVVERLTEAASVAACQS